MEGTRFINLLKKNRFRLVLIPVITMVLAFVLTRKMPNVYSSKGTLSAGLVEGSQTMMMDKSMLQDAKINQQFSNLIQIMQMKKVYDQVSYQLILHDLTSKEAFHKPSKLLSELNPNARQHAFEVYKDCYINRRALSLWSQDEKGLNDVLKSMGYDYESLQKKIRVYRIENTDFINVECETDSPTLSADIVNILCSEFINYYASLTKENEFRAIQFLDTVLQQKKDSLNTKVVGLKDFKIKNHVLNLNEQAKTLLSQMSDIEMRIQMVEKEIKANEGALESINRKFQGNGGRIMVDSAQVMSNRKIIQLKEHINALYDSMVKSGFDNAYKMKRDSLIKILDREMNAGSDRAAFNPQSAKDNLLSQKLNLEINRDLARSSIKSLEEGLALLKRRFDALVPNEAVIQSYENNIGVASQEYIEILKKYNQTSMAYNSSVQLKQIEMAMPNPPQPSKKMLLVAISGIGSLFITILVLFVLFYLDSSIQFAQELANKTNFAVLGVLPLISNTDLLDLNKLWEYDALDTENRDFKNQLRSIRFETDELMHGSHTVTITSLCDNSGKSFLAMSLANAFVMVNKHVLLIDGNFINPSVTRLSKTTKFIEDYLTDKSYAPHPDYENEVTVLGNRGMDISLLEIGNEIVIRKKIEELKELYDIIIIESGGLNTLNQAKEWIALSDKVICVYESGKSIRTSEKPYLEYLRSLNEKYLGWVLNKVRYQPEDVARKSGLFRKK
jgi:uncharacterized protein involved in exopolysaccharide biosynthesis/Mrp family chromosome partitioning ATPase